MQKKQPVIRTESYVRTAEGGLIRFDDLTDAQKRKAATDLKLRMMRAMFPGIDFYVADSNEPSGGEGTPCRNAISAL